MAKWIPNSTIYQPAAEAQLVRERVLSRVHTRLTWAAFRSGLRERDTPTSNPNTRNHEVSLVRSDLLRILL